MILYIHPRSQTMLTEIYPISLPAIINRLKMPVKGLFQYELKDRDIRSAEFVLMDIHWYTSLAHAISLSQRIRRVNNDIVIIAGGITATLFAKQILRDSEVDYIIRGDAEVPVSELIETIVQGKNPEAVANVVSRDFVSNRVYSLNTEDFDASDYRDISFFPTLERRAFRLHSRSHGKPFPTYPFLMAFRGCPFECVECCGSVKLQQRLFKRKWVVQSAEKLKNDLDYWDADDRVSFVNIYHDFVSLLPMEYSEKILSRHYNLSVFYDFFRCPSKEQLELVLDSFKGGVLHFGLDQFHGNSKKIAPLDDLNNRLTAASKTGRFNVRLTFNRNFMTDPDYAGYLKAIVEKTGAWTYNGDFWWENNPTIDEEGWGSETDYQRCLKDRGRRYLLWNTIYRAGTTVHRYFPQLANIGAKIWFKL